MENILICLRRGSPVRRPTRPNHLSLFAPPPTLYPRSAQIFSSRMSKHRKRGGVARNRNTGRQDHWGAGDEIFDAEVDDGRFDEPSEYVLVSLEERAAEAARRAGVATERPSTDASWTDLDAASCVVVPTTDVSITLKDFKLKIADIIREYFTSEDVVECERALVELDASVFHFEFVKRAITMSMDFKDRERELVSRILSTFSSDVLRRHDIGKGFERVFEQLDDLVLDCPTAYTIVTQFLARAVADEALPPVFLADPLVQRLGGEVVDQAKVLLSMKHGLSRLEHVWGPGDGRSTADLKEAVLQLVQEYLAAGDMGEAARCIRELNAAPFHHEGACYFLPPQHAKRNAHLSPSAPALSRSHTHTHTHTHTHPRPRLLSLYTLLHQSSSALLSSQWIATMRSALWSLISLHFCSPRASYLPMVLRAASGGCGKRSRT